ncbi:MAG: response regulator transcription factor [Ornithinibacter sp.]
MIATVSAGSARSQAGADTLAPVRVAVVDNHPLLRNSIRSILGDARDMEWVGEAEDGGEAVELVTRTRPDVVLMDLSMPGTDGLTATRSIVGSCPATQVLVLTSSTDPSRVRHSIGAGAAGVLTKDGDPSTILTGIRALVGDCLPEPTP